MHTTDPRERPNFPGLWLALDVKVLYLIRVPAESQPLPGLPVQGDWCVHGLSVAKGRQQMPRGRLTGQVPARLPQNLRPQGVVQE